MIFDPELQKLGTIFFLAALLHIFFAAKIRRWSLWLGEVELVFAIWAILFSIVAIVWASPAWLLGYLKSLHFGEAIFVAVMMVIASTNLILKTAGALVVAGGNKIAKCFRILPVQADVFVLLFLGPLLGSLITEVGAITMTSLLLLKMIRRTNLKLNYQILAVLFVNVSIGGALTPFAAPPILMVARKWQWGFAEVFSLFGWKSILIVLFNTVFFVWICRKEISENLISLAQSSKVQPIQSSLKFRESLLVGLFLAGLIFFGPLQTWWVSKVLQVVTEYALLGSATLLTAVLDNAALTYLGSQVEGLSDSSKYFLVAGAIAGGGLTVIANAPNPAGYAILQKQFPDGLSALKLARAAFLPTLVAVLVFSIK